MARILPGETDLYALTDTRLSRGRSVMEVAEKLVKSGIKIIQYREKHLSRKAMYEECKILKELASQNNLCFIINDHIDLALSVGADGIHIGQEDLPLLEARSIVGDDMIIGVSTHSPEQALRAVEEGADYIGVGPIFHTTTKEDVCSPVGLEYLDWVTRNIDIPFVAIGGIKSHNIGQVVAHGAKCCALVSEFVGATDIEAKIAETRREFQKGIKKV